MFETDQIDSLLPEDVPDNHLTTIKKTNLQQYKISLQR